MPIPFTTSSITDNDTPTSPPSEIATDPSSSHPPEERLDPRRLEVLRTLLLNGASPAAACSKLGISLDAFFSAAVEDADLRRLLLQAQQVLSQNVAAALYVAAMKGSVSAQTFYLRNLPPPEWTTATGDGREDECPLTDEELALRCRALGIEFPTETLGTPDNPEETLGVTEVLGGPGEAADPAES